MRTLTYVKLCCGAAGILVCGAVCAQTLLVVNQGDSSVSFVDAAKGKQVAVFAENTPGVHAHEAAVSADGRYAFFPVYGSTGVGKPGIDGHEMLVVDMQSRDVVAHVDWGRGVRPHMALLDAASGRLYVTTELDKTVSIVDPKTWKIVGNVPTGAEQSHMLALSSDGKRGYTANVGPGTVSVLDMVGRKTLAVIPVSGTVQRIAVSRDDKWVFTADQMKPQIAVIDASTNMVKRWVGLPSLGYGTATTPDGKSLLVALPKTNQVAVIDLATMKMVRVVDVATTPQEILVRPDGKVAYVSCVAAGQVAAVDLETWKVDRIDAGKGADGLAWAR